MRPRLDGTAALSQPNVAFFGPTSKEVLSDLLDDLSSVVSVAMELWERFNLPRAGVAREGFTEEVPSEMD